MQSLASNKCFGLVDTDHKSLQEAHNSSPKQRYPYHACDFLLDQGWPTYGTKLRLPWQAVFTDVQIFTSLVRPAYLYCEGHVFTYIHISDCIQSVYALPLLPNNTASETFLFQSGAMWSVDWIFITGAPAWRWLGEYVALDRTFYSLLFIQEVLVDPVTAIFSSLSCSSRRTLL